MSEHVKLIGQMLEHLYRMKGYLDYSAARVSSILPIIDFRALTPQQHESLAAFRVRFGEFQEQLGKAMRAVALEEEADVERFGSVLAFMEKIGVIDSAESWKVIRELRNAINHEYEDDELRITRLFAELTKAVPTLLAYFKNLTQHCKNAYSIYIDTA